MNKHFELVEMPASYNLPASVINEAIKYIMHTSIGAKLFICKLDYCLKVDESSLKKGICEGTAQSIY